VEISASASRIRARNFCIRAYVKSHCHFSRADMYVRTKKEKQKKEKKKKGGKGGGEKKSKERKESSSRPGCNCRPRRLLSRRVTRPIHPTTSRFSFLSLALVAIDSIFRERDEEKETEGGERERERGRERGTFLAFASSRLASLRLLGLITDPIKRADYRLSI